MDRYIGNRKAMAVATIAGVLASLPAFAFNSGSTGTDGAFNPAVNTALQLPPNGIFNFTSVNIPAGVTVTFKRNTTNTPVVILASGNVTIAGTIDISGSGSNNVGAAGDGNLGDDGIPGQGGPGGYDGGVGGKVPNGRGGNGLGPGGASGGAFSFDPSCGSQAYFGGGGGGFGGDGGVSQWCSVGTSGGPAYGSSLLLPLVGGSGGGGGSGGSSFAGSGGGGGGGAILIASSGIANITGGISTNGGSSGGSSGVGVGSNGGGGSGGAIRIVATTISGNGGLNATGGGVGSLSGASGGTRLNGGGGSTGRIRLEAEIMQRTAATNPAASFSAPGQVFVAGLPTLRISRVAGVDSPAQPTGNADITLPASTPNPMTVEFITTGVPVGNTVKLTVTPSNAAAVIATSPAITGTTDNGSTSVSVVLPSGPSTLQATVSYTVIVAMGEELSKFAKGERVEKVTLTASLNGSSMVTLTTVSGKEYTMSSTVTAGVLKG